MPTNVTHAVPAIAVGFGVGRNVLPIKLILTGAVIASIPDLDIIGTRFFGVPWDSVYGHRGFTHSISFALVTALIFTKFFNQKDFKKVFLFLSFCMLSHGFLDLCNEGGLGVAMLWPLTDFRYQGFVHPIMNVNTSFRGLYLTSQGLPVFISEFLWVWLPFFFVFLFLKLNGLDFLKKHILKG
jgi:inner membrane protein